MKHFIQLNQFLKPYKWYILAGFLFIVLSKIFAIFPARFISQAFDEVKQALETAHLSNSSAIYKEITNYALMIVGAALVNGFFLFLTRQTIIVASRKIEYDIKNTIYEQYQQLSRSFYKKHNTGDLMSRIGEDVSKVRMYFGPAIMYSMNLTVLFILVIATMLSISIELTLYTLLPLPFLALLIYYVSKTIHQKSEQVQIKLAGLSTNTQESFSGIRVIKSFDTSSYMKSKFTDQNQAYYSASLSLAKTNALFHPFMILLIGLSTILTIYIGGRLCAEGKVSTGNIAEFVIYVNMLTWPVASLGWVTSLTQRALASYKRIDYFLKINPEIVNQKNAQQYNFGDIKLNNVSLKYQDTGIEALKKINLTISKGSTIGIVGKTGSGKSSLASLISRMYDCTEGTIEIDQKNISSINLFQLRDHIAMVNQDVFLFSQTIAQNIVFGLKRSYTNQEIVWAAQQACVDENIKQLKDQYQTLLGERGVNLSGGQKQRISIARALIKDADILILDDCLSAVDTETEHQITQNIKTLTKEKTCIIIAQRVSTVRHADCIITLDEGRIVQQGTHEQLIKTKGFYQDLYHKQQI